MALRGGELCKSGSLSQQQDIGRGILPQRSGHGATSPALLRPSLLGPVGWQALMLTQPSSIAVRHYATFHFQVWLPEMRSEK